MTISINFSEIKPVSKYLLLGILLIGLSLFSCNNNNLEDISQEVSEESSANESVLNEDNQNSNSPEESDTAEKDREITGEKKQEKDATEVGEAIPDTGTVFKKGSWKVISNILSPRWGSAMAEQNGVLYIYGGINEEKYLNDFWSYGIAENKSSELAENKPRAFATLTAVDGKLYLFGGEYHDGKKTNSLLEYDIETGTWIKKTCRKSARGVRPKSRSLHSALYYKDPETGHRKILVYGGMGKYSKSPHSKKSSNIRGWVHELDLDAAPKPKWRKKAKGPRRAGHGAAIIGDIMYVFGGFDPRTDENKNELWAYNISLDEWSLVDNLPLGVSNRSGIQLLALGNSLFVYGGLSDSVYQNDLWQMNPPDLWKNISKAPSARAYYSAIVFKKKIYIFGGYNDTESFGDLLIYSIKKNPKGPPQKKPKEKPVPKK